MGLTVKEQSNWTTKTDKSSLVLKTCIVGVYLCLQLTVNGTATVALTAGGQIDLKKPATNVLLEGNLEPR